MKNLDLIAEELFNKIRGRFPSVTIGDGEGKVTNKPVEARFYDFDYTEGETKLGRVSVNLTDDSIAVMYSNDFVANEDVITKENWYNFLKELRAFSKKRLLKFDTRNINKSNLDQRDYKFLATNRTGDGTMTESKMYGTNKTSYQNVGQARIAIKHSKPVNTESAIGRIQNINKIFIESPEGEKFIYPFRHLNGARAMARHVAEGGKPYDEFGKHITGLSEELSSLKKFKSYVGRSSVMAEGLSGYMLPVNERLNDIKKTISSLQKESTYRTAFENFEQPVLEDVPEDVAENWIDQLTIRQFNEELKDVFPFVYRLVSETTKAKIISANDLLGEAPVDNVEVGSPAETYTVQQGDTLYSIARKFQDANFQGADINDAVAEIMELNGISDPSSLQIGQKIEMPYFMGSGPDGATRGLPPGGFKKYESELEDSFEEMMGQFSSLEEAAGCSCNDGGKCTCPSSCTDCNCNESTSEGNKFTAALAKAKANDDDEMEVDGEKIPVTEFILSLYDRNTGQFPKGETAVLTAVEKDYGEQYINPAKAFIEAINAKFEEFNGYRDPELMDGTDDDYKYQPFDDEISDVVRTLTPGSKRRDMGKRKVDTKAPIIDIDDMEFFLDDDVETGESALQAHIGRKKYGKDGMAALSQAGREGASEEELGAIKDKYKKESEDLRRLAGL
jgi:LysM repeat protein